MDAAVAWRYCTEKITEKSNRKIGKNFVIFLTVAATMRRIFI